jgi:pimeloyl-ACP methyl ester carboxylesterase
MRRAGLLILFFVCAQVAIAAPTDEKPVPYGNNPNAGHYLQVGDVKIYYEIYGTGHLLVMLHGGLLGYIDELEGVIPELSRHYTVIAIALRGHGNSELGTQPLSHALFAEDSAAVIRHVAKEPVDLLGFSSGAMASYLITIQHPELVHRLIAVGGPISSSGAPEEAAAGHKEAFDPAEFEKQLPARFLARRDKIYPDRAAWNRLVAAFSKISEVDEDIPKEKVQAIQIPTLIAAGDQDGITKLEHFVEIYHLIPHAELAIVPGCGHTVFRCNPNLMSELIETFLNKN